MTAAYDNCTEEEFLAMCDRRGIRGMERLIYLDMFRRAAHVAGTRKASPREKLKLDIFIREGRKW